MTSVMMVEVNSKKCDSAELLADDCIKSRGNNGVAALEVAMEAVMAAVILMLKKIYRLPKRAANLFV